MRQPLTQDQLKQRAEEVRDIIAKKVTGRVIPRFTPYEHFYELWDGNQVASVTTKMIVEKPHLRIWAVKVGIEWLCQDNRLQKLQNAISVGDTEYQKALINGAQQAHTDIRDDAGSVGTDAHDAVEAWILEWIKVGVKPGDIKEFFQRDIKDVDLRSVAAARSVVKMFETESVYPVMPEILVGSVQYQGAGMLDILVLNEFGDIEVWDWKTSNGVDDTYAMQLAAYCNFFMEMTGLSINAVRIVHLSKDYDKFTLYTVPDIDEAYEAFIAIAKVYNWYKNGKQKLIKGKKPRLKL